MQLQKKNIFFYTDRESLNTFVYMKQANGTYMKRAYLPDSHETMNNKAIETFRRHTCAKFLMWAFSNKERIQDGVDRRIVTSQLIDVNFGLMGSACAGFFLFKFLGRIESSFLELFFEDKFIKLNTLRLGSSIALTAYGIHLTYKNLFNQKFLYDLALEYKEQYMPNQITDSNVESILAKFLPIQKIPVQSEQQQQQQQKQ